MVPRIVFNWIHVLFIYHQNIAPNVPAFAAAAEGDTIFKELFEAGENEERAQKLNVFLEGFCALLDNLNAD